MVFFVTWIIRVVYYIVDLLFASTLQTLYDRVTGNGTPAPTAHTRHRHPQIHISPQTSPLTYFVGACIAIVLFDRFSVFVGHYSERDGDERWAAETLATMCGDDKRYRGRMYEDNCREAYKIKNSGRIPSAFQKTLSDTHVCIWWDCGTLMYNTLTSMPSLATAAVFIIFSIFMCGGASTRGLPQTITFVPAPPPPSTPPKTSNSQKYK